MNLSQKLIKISKLEKYIYIEGVLNLFFLLLDIKKISKIEVYNNKSSISLVILVLNELGLFYYLNHINNELLISTKEENLKLGIKYFIKNTNHNKFGELLGFPKCCIKNFSRYNFFRGVNDDLLYDFIRDKISNKINSSNYLNFFEDKLIYHLPCSMNCSNSIEIGKKILPFYLGLKKDKQNISLFEEKYYILFRNLEWVKIYKDKYYYGSIYGNSGNKYVDKIKKGYKILILNDNKINLINGSNVENIDDFIIFKFNNEL